MIYYKMREPKPERIGCHPYSLSHCRPSLWPSQRRPDKAWRRLDTLGARDNQDIKPARLLRTLCSSAMMTMLIGLASRLRLPESRILAKGFVISTKTCSNQTVF
jgi:hypothetical protein